MADDGGRPRAVRAAVVGTVLGLLVGAGAAAGTAALLWPDGSNGDPRLHPDKNDLIVHAAPVRSGEIEMEVRTLQCGLEFTTGTHAEAMARGQFCAVRVTFHNDQPVTADIDTRRQELVLDDGSVVQTGNEVMQIKRQLRTQSVGGRNVITLDLWYDIPVDRHPKAIRLISEPDLRGHEPPRPVDVPLPRYTKRN
ncbi:DUF4352 domain-containing protein [Yinghuangia soli]|uniref:DUF4352 domain-containing protein n=1 Tax=Yinghuangia soli TaxID=2908204 RepID=A0AA41Q347_9ACTN|nr:DUF4352 domain-containing protein [Yinghuangia soli]MCF2530441.1 DUF4352 domain-containing protein [Yinghuangia soli]